MSEKEPVSDSGDTQGAGFINKTLALIHVICGFGLAAWFFRTSGLTAVWLFGVGSGSVVLSIAAGLSFLTLPSSDTVRREARSSALKLSLPVHVEEEYVRYRSQERLILLIVNWIGIAVFLWIWHYFGLAVIALAPIIQDLVIFLYFIPLIGYVLFVVFLLVILYERVLLHRHPDIMPILELLKKSQTPDESGGEDTTADSADSAKSEGP